MRSKIAAAVDRGPDTAVIADPATASASALARSGVRCVTFESERYCLYFGWTHRTKKELVRHVAETAPSETGTADNGTGGTSLLQTLRAHAALPLEQQVAAETKQFESAATGLAKLVELRHEVEGTPIPAGFYDRHPGAASPAMASPMSPPNPPPTGYPKHFYILNTHWIKSQHKKNWCGPTAMQSIAWNYHGSKQTQHTWSNRLGTTSAGTSIWRIVKAVNRYTGYDKSYHAGKYITLDISGYGYGRWYRLNKRHYWKYTAPVVLHPKLGKKWYYYLDRNEGGHFQVGRGYRTRSGKVNQVSYFEPWNPHYFNQGRPYIGRVHRLSAKKQYYANEANQFQNIGV